MPIAVTGGIAEGKSTVTGFLEEMGFSILSTDSLAHEFFDEPDVNRQLARIVGQEYPLDRRTLRDRLVQSIDVRRSVNRLMHPLISRAVRDSQADFVEVPLLIEACLYGEYGGTWVVTCGPEEQFRRIRSRYGTDCDVNAILRTQLSTSSKIPFADVVIRTNCTFETVRQNISSAIECGFGLSLLQGLIDRAILHPICLFGKAASWRLNRRGQGLEGCLIVVRLPTVLLKSNILAIGFGPGWLSKVRANNMRAGRPIGMRIKEDAS